MVEVLKTATLESLARALTILSFVTLCWVSHRTLQVRESCVTSTFIAFVQIGTARADNCRFESRLNLTSGSNLQAADGARLRALEILEPLSSVFPQRNPDLTVEISVDNPHAFDLGAGAVRIGEAWLNDSVQVRRALIMAALKSAHPESYNQFQLEVLSDFLLLALYTDDGTQGEISLRRDVKFPTAAPSLGQYCLSPFRSLAHHQLCQLPDLESGEEATQVWGFRPLLASALWRAFDKLPLQQQVQVLERIRHGQALPVVDPAEHGDVENLVGWFENTFKDYAGSLGILASERGELALKQAMKELEVEAPTKWELTVDVTKTPAWKEIVEQLKTRARFRLKERALIFTPEGEFALPSGLPVAWSASDISSQKHVLIACEWPKPGEAVHVQARQLFAQRSCEKLKRAFWD